MMVLTNQHWFSIWKDFVGTLSRHKVNDYFVRKLVGMGLLTPYLSLACITKVLKRAQTFSIGVSDAR